MKLTKEEKVNLRMFAVETAMSVTDTVSPSGINSATTEEILAKAQKIYDFIVGDCDCKCDKNVKE